MITSEDQFTTDPKHLQKAAGFALRTIAKTDGLLLRAVQAAVRASDQDREGASKALESVLPVRFFEEAHGATGVSEVELAPTVLEQLRRVSIFARLDGGQMEDNIPAAENLIRSGRVELFAR